MSNFNPNFDREKLAFLELANRGNGLDSISYMYCKSGSFENILTAIIKGGTAELYMLYAHGIDVKYLEVLQLKAGDIKANTIEVNTITSDTINNKEKITTDSLTADSIRVKLHSVLTGVTEIAGLCSVDGELTVIGASTVLGVMNITGETRIVAPSAVGFVRIAAGGNISMDAPTINIGKLPILGLLPVSTSTKNINIQTNKLDLLNSITMVSPIINIGTAPGVADFFQASTINISTAILPNNIVSEIENINIQTSELKPLSTISMLAPIINIGAFAGVENLFQAKTINISTAALVPSIVSANEKITIQTSNLDPINNVSIYSRIINIGDDRGIDIGTNTINIQTNKVPAISDNINIKSTEINIGSSEKTSTINITTLVNESTINIGDRTTTEINLRTNFLADNAVLSLESPTINIGNLQTGYINLITANAIAGLINIGSSTINIGIDTDNNPVAKQITIQTTPVDSSSINLQSSNVQIIAGVAISSLESNEIGLFSIRSINTAISSDQSTTLTGDTFTMAAVTNATLKSPVIYIGIDSDGEAEAKQITINTTTSGDSKVSLVSPVITLTAEESSIRITNVYGTEIQNGLTVNTGGIYSLGNIAADGNIKFGGKITFYVRAESEGGTYTWPSPPVLAPIPGFTMNYLDCESVTGLLVWKSRDIEAVVTLANNRIRYLICNTGALSWAERILPLSDMIPIGVIKLYPIVNHLSCDGSSGVLSWRTTELHIIGTLPVAGVKIQAEDVVAIEGKSYKIPSFKGEA